MTADTPPEDGHRANSAVVYSLYVAAHSSGKMADGIATLEVADSKFLAFVRPAASSQDAASFQAELKSRFPGAAHVYSMKGVAKLKVS